ncbi:MAG TPA: DUF3619 family protein [Steroidobacteraceae bacterium]|nr:DUF3619 family protein [Steroidobacteraceae bacterium]
MSQENEPSAFEKRTREVLEESTARLDGRTLSRLTQARHAALEQQARPARQAWRTLMPVGAAAAGVLAVVMITGRHGGDVQPGVEGPMDDLELLADADAPDFVDGEDLEFYEWAAGETES